MKKILIILIVLSSFQIFSANNESYIKLGRVKYSGGGDWYNDQSAEVNLLSFAGRNTNIPVSPVYDFVDLKSTDIMKYPVLFMTGHGNVNFSDREVENLKTYIENGGFLFIDDDYGMDEYIKEELKKVFPENDLVEVPFEHPIYNIHYNFPQGPPKIHEHDDNPPQAYGLFINGRLSVYYTYESNPSDGWADSDVHKNSPEIRQEALKFGTNIIVWALTN